MRTRPKSSVSPMRRATARRVGNLSRRRPRRASYAWGRDRYGIRQPRHHSEARHLVRGAKLSGDDNELTELSIREFVTNKVVDVVVSSMSPNLPYTTRTASHKASRSRTLMSTAWELRSHLCGDAHGCTVARGSAVDVDVVVRAGHLKIRIGRAARRCGQPDT